MWMRVGCVFWQGYTGHCIHSLHFVRGGSLRVQRDIVPLPLMPSGDEFSGQMRNSKLL